MLLNYNLLVMKNLIVKKQSFTKDLFSRTITLAQSRLSSLHNS